MYIRRKVFSVAVDEMGEEKYFSINEVINEEDYLNEVMYSKHVHETEKKKDKLYDRVGLISYKTVPKKDRKNYRDIFDKQVPEEDKKKAKKSQRRRMAAYLGAYGGLMGGLEGKALSNIAKEHGVNLGSRFVAKNALKSGALGAGAAYLGTALGQAGAEKLRKHSKKMDNYYQREADLARRSLGEMSDEDYINKYGKLKKDKNKTDNNNKKQEK